MANSVGNLFTRYSATYSKAGGEDAEREPLTAKELKKASRNELRGFDGDILRVSKRGGNFLDRVVCWLERRVFSLTRSGQRDSSRQKHSQEFAAHVGDALAEIGVGAEGEGKHDLIRKIESVQKRDLPLRSGFVQSILQEVAALQRNAGQGVLPDIAQMAFPPAAEVIHQVEIRDQGVVVPDGQLEPGRAAEVVHGDRDEGLPQVPANRDNEPEIVQQNLPVPNILRNNPADPIQPKRFDEFSQVSGSVFTERLSGYTGDMLIGPCLNEEVNRRGIKISSQVYNKIVNHATLELAVFTYQVEDGERPIFGTYNFAQDLHERWVGENNKATNRATPEQLEHDVLYRTACNICNGNEDWVKNYVVERLNLMGAVALPENANQGIPQQQAPMQAPVQAEQAIGAFQFAQQSDQDFKNSLLDPVKTKLVNPVLEGKGFYIDTTDAKILTADAITSDMVDHVIKHHGGAQQAKEAVDQNLGLLKLASNPNASENQLQNQALENVIVGLATNHKDDMYAAVNVLYEARVRVADVPEAPGEVPPPPQAPQEQPVPELLPGHGDVDLMAPQAPQLEEGARVQPLNLDPVPAEPAIEGFQFTQQNDEAFKASLFDLISARLVYPVLEKKGLYNNPTQETMRNASVILRAITTDMGDYVINKNGGYMQVKNVANENLNVLRSVAEPNDTDEQLQKNALNAVIDGWITNDKVGLDAVVGNMYETRVGGAPKAPAEVAPPPQMRPQVVPGPDDFSQPVGSKIPPHPPQAQRVAPLVDQPLGAPDSLHGAEAIRIGQPNLDPAKERAIDDFVRKLERNELKNRVRAAAHKVIDVAGYANATGIESDFDSPLHHLYADHIAGNNWEHHKEFAKGTFSNVYDNEEKKALDEGKKIDLQKVEDTTMKVFIINFSGGFRYAMQKV